MLDIVSAYIERKKNATMQSRPHVLAPSGISNPKKKKKNTYTKKSLRNFKASGG